MIHYTYNAGTYWQIVPLLKEMKDSNYNVYLSETKNPRDGAPYCGYHLVVREAATTLSFKMQTCSHYEYVYWKVEGFAK